MSRRRPGRSAPAGGCRRGSRHSPQRERPPQRSASPLSTRAKRPLRPPRRPTCQAVEPVDEVDPVHEHDGRTATTRIGPSGAGSLVETRRHRRLRLRSGRRSARQGTDPGGRRPCPKPWRVRAGAGAQAAVAAAPTARPAKDASSSQVGDRCGLRLEGPGTVDHAESSCHGAAATGGDHRGRQGRPQRAGRSCSPCAPAHPGLDPGTVQVTGRSRSSSESSCPDGARRSRHVRSRPARRARRPQVAAPTTTCADRAGLCGPLRRSARPAGAYSRGRARPDRRRRRAVRPAGRLAPRPLPWRRVSTALGGMLDRRGARTGRPTTPSCSGKLLVEAAGVEGAGRKPTRLLVGVGHEQGTSSVSQRPRRE